MRPTPYRAVEAWARMECATSLSRMTPSRIASHVRLVRTEVLATLREAVLLPRDLAPVVPHPSADAEDVVVLLHGFLASGGVFRPMRSELEAEGFHVATFSYAPGRTVRSVANQLAAIVRRLPSRARVHLVGHSFGGLVARDYVQHLGGHERVVQTISLASPFHGTPRAQRFSWLVGDLHPESPMLASIRACPPHVRVPHMSIVAGSDRMIPPSSARLPGAPSVTLPDRGHNTLLFDAEVIRILLAQLQRVARLTAA
jgi:triacylglycerol lipase